MRRLQSAKNKSCSGGKKINEVWTDWPQKAKTGIPDSIAYYYADDVIVKGQESPFATGKAEMIKIYDSSPTNFGLDIKWAAKPGIIQFSREGDMAYSVARNELSFTDSTGSAHHTFNQALHIWKKNKEGNWKVSLLMIYPEKNR